MGGFKCYNPKQDDYKVDYELNPIGATRLVQAVIKNCFADPIKMSDGNKINFFRRHINFAMLQKNLIIHHFCDIYDIDEMKLRTRIVKYNSKKINNITKNYALNR